MPMVDVKRSRQPKWSCRSFVPEVFWLGSAQHWISRVGPIHDCKSAFKILRILRPGAPIKDSFLCSDHNCRAALKDLQADRIDTNRGFGDDLDLAGAKLL
jgi:hypothetical protein